MNKKIFGALFLSLFATVTGVGIVVPLLPVYAHSLGAGGLYISMIFGAFSLSRTFLLPYFGRLSDRKGRKPFIITGLFVYALVSIAFIFSESVNSLIIIRFFQGIASAMIMPVSQAYIGDITPKGREGFYMGLFSLSMFGSLSIGPLLGGVINERYGLDSTFAAMGMLAFIGFLASLILLPPRKSEHAIHTENKPASWRHLLRNRKLVGIFSIRTGYATCIGIIWCFLPVFADKEFNLSSSLIGMLVMLGVFISGVLQTPMGYLADRGNKKLMVILGSLIVSGAVLYYEWAHGFWDLFIAAAVFGFGGGICMPAIMAIAVQEGNNNRAMGSVMAFMTLAHSMGMLAGSILAGITMDLLELRHAFGFGALVMGISVLLFVFFTRLKPVRNPLLLAESCQQPIGIPPVDESIPPPPSYWSD